MGGRKVIAFAGLPLVGKSVLARVLEARLQICRIDIDEIRRLLFGHQPVDPEKERERDRLQMKMSWKSLFELTSNVLEAGESVIITGTFSRESYHKQLFEVLEKQQASLKLIFCYAPDEVIAHRIELRKKNEAEPSNLKSMEGYNRVRKRYVKIDVPDILDLDTSASIEECLKKILEFVS